MRVIGFEFLVTTPKPRWMPLQDCGGKIGANMLSRVNAGRLPLSKALLHALSHAVSQSHDGAVFEYVLTPYEEQSTFKTVERPGAQVLACRAIHDCERRRP